MIIWPDFTLPPINLYVMPAMPYINSDKAYLTAEMPEHTQADLKYFVDQLGRINDDFTTVKKLNESRKQALYELKKHKGIL